MCVYMQHKVQWHPFPIYKYILVIPICTSLEPNLGVLPHASSLGLAFSFHDPIVFRIHYRKRKGESETFSWVTHYIPDNWIYIYVWGYTYIFISFCVDEQCVGDRKDIYHVHPLCGFRDGSHNASWGCRVDRNYH